MKDSIIVTVVLVGFFLFLVSYNGVNTIVDETVAISPYGYKHYHVNTYPFQSLHVSAIVVNEDIEALNLYALELRLLNDDDYQAFQSGDYGSIGFHEREWLSINSLEDVSVFSKGFENYNVVLDNKIRAWNRSLPKETEIRVTILNPYGYLRIPGVLLVSLGVYWLFTKKYRIVVREPL